MRNNWFIILIFITLIEFNSSVFSQDSVRAITPLEEISSYKDDSTAKAEYLKELKEISKDTSIVKSGQFSSNFQEKYYKDKEFDYHRDEVKRSIWEKIKERIYKILSILFGWGKNYKIGKATNTFYYVISAIIILTALFFIVKFLIQNKDNLFFKRKDKEIKIDVNDLEQLIQHANFEGLISESEQQGNARQSIRLYYLWLLQYLKDKDMIEWDLNKTNGDYISEIKNENIRQKFSYLSYLFNYIWYGEFSINDTEYQRAKKAFLNFLRKN